MNNQFEIVVFNDEEIVLEVNFDKDNDTVWLTQDQIATLFNRDRTVINRHIRNIFRNGELDEKSNVQKMHIANSDKPTSMFSLDIPLEPFVPNYLTIHYIILMNWRDFFMNYGYIRVSSYD